MMNQTQRKKNYYEQTFGKEDPVLQRISSQARNEKIEFMQLSPADARILGVLAASCQAKKAVEIGGLYGYSALHIARALAPGGVLFSLDMDLKRQNISKQLLTQEPEFKKIKWINGDAHQTLNTLSPEAPFDFIFIDADKGGYMDYFLWAEKHLKIGGVVVLDNTFLFDTLFSPEPELSKLRKLHGVSPAAENTIKKVNQRLARSPWWTSAMIPTEDGLSAGVKTSSPEKNTDAKL